MLLRFRPAHIFDQCRVRKWLDCSRLQNKPIEEFAPVVRCSAVETKGLFIVEVIVQMLTTDGTLVSVQQPAFEESGDFFAISAPPCEHLKYQLPSYPEKTELYTQRSALVAGKYQSSTCPFDRGRPKGTAPVSKVASSVCSKVSDSSR